MQTTSTIKRIPLDEGEAPPLAREKIGEFEANISLSQGIFSASIFERHLCERQRVSRVKVVETTESHASRGWIAVEASGFVLGGIGTLSLAPDSSECLHCSNAILIPLFFVPMMIGGGIATIVDLRKGGTKVEERVVETQPAQEMRECRSPVGPSVEVSLVWPGLSPLVSRTNSAGQVTLELGDRKAPFELWVGGKPLRRITESGSKP